MATDQTTAPPSPQSWGVEDRGSANDSSDGGYRESAKRRRQSSPGIGGRGGGALALFLTILLALFLFPSVARADALDDRVREISKGLRCPVCNGETVADSNAPISVQMRGIVREKLQAGESPDQIRAYFVARYGPEILLTPETSGFTLGVWIMPIVALVGGFLIVLAVLRSWSRRGAGPAEPDAPTPDDEGETLPPDDDARLEQELSRFRHGQARGGGVSG